MNACIEFPLRLHWTAQDLADAIPLRLSQIMVFTMAAGANDSGNDDCIDRPFRRELPGRYLPKITPPHLFRVYS